MRSFTIAETCKDGIKANGPNTVYICSVTNNLVAEPVLLRDCPGDDRCLVRKDGARCISDNRTVVPECLCSSYEIRVSVFFFLQSAH